ncbi:uncharacterized protein LOC136091925 [Hydra vulgaris]|uniref:Uncharacterized protein LOC136091925 n=1 Tax=Hydra vulgaris TaxID=6087 RepID=A0ABM4DME2_HYDVU
MQQRGNDLRISDLMFRLQTIISEENPFAFAFKNMAEVEDEEIRRAALEVAVVFVGEDGAPPASREVVIYPRGHPLKTISSMSANIDPMVYLLFFPRGNAGWHNQLVHNPERATLVRNHVTLSQYYNYKLSVRQFFSSLFYGKKLFQQYAFDVYVIIEGQRLGFIRNNQNKLRSEQYDVLHKYVNNLENDHNVRPGRVVVLPSTYVGSPKALKHGVLGKVVTHVLVIEFQKCGLPHVHILLHFANDDKLETAHDINNLIFAEIPNPIVNRDLYDIVETCVIHSPCGILNPNSPCMKDGMCSKNYPKEFNANTVAVHYGYPRFSRRDIGLVINIKGNNVDNRWVVPYNPSLSKKYQAHINVEAYMSVKAVKYLYKYIFKGHDCANILVNEKINHDEVNTFLDCRYISAPEALWQIFEYPISHMSHTIIRLKIHLPKNQLYFREGAEQMALDRAAQRDTHLTAWFKLNTENERAHCYSYVHIPYHFIFDDKHCKWKVRQRGGNKVILRMYKVNPTGELFFLRLLLLHAKGATSWEDVRTVNGIVLETFREAFILKGLLQDDTEWQNILSEAVLTCMPKQIRQLFSIILTFCETDNPLHLWNTYKVFMMEDFIHCSAPFLIAEQDTLH